MKIEIIYHELKRKEFRSKKTLRNFLNTKLDSEILKVVEIKNKIYYLLEMKQFLLDNKWNDDDET